MYCSKCRKQINTEDKFCNNCSNQIESTIVNQYEQNTNKNSDNQNPDKNYINNDSKKKGKTAAIIIGLILLVIRFGGKFVINKEEFSDFNDKITIAIEKVNENILILLLIQMKYMLMLIDMKINGMLMFLLKKIKDWEQKYTMKMELIQ